MHTLWLCTVRMTLLSKSPHGFKRTALSAELHSWRFRKLASIRNLLAFRLWHLSLIDVYFIFYIAFSDNETVSAYVIGIFTSLTQSANHICSHFTQAQTYF